LQASILSFELVELRVAWQSNNTAVITKIVRVISVLTPVLQQSSFSVSVYIKQCRLWEEMGV